MGQIMSDRVIEKYGFRSMINSQYQSWSGFTSQLFGGDEQRGELDSLQFIFNREIGTSVTYTDSIDEISLTAAYFGRPIEHTIFYFPRTETLENKLSLIKDTLPSFFTRCKKNKLSEPIFIIENINDEEVRGYYIWQYK